MIAAAEARRRRVILVPSQENRRTSESGRCGVPGSCARIQGLLWQYQGEALGAWLKLNQSEAAAVALGAAKTTGRDISDKSECPVISLGCGRPIRASMVGATSASLPSDSEWMLAGAPNSRAGTRFSVCWVCF